MPKYKLLTRIHLTTGTTLAAGQIIEMDEKDAKYWLSRKRIAPFKGEPDQAGFDFDGDKAPESPEPPVDDLSEPPAL